VLSDAAAAVCPRVRAVGASGQLRRFAAGERHSSSDHAAAWFREVGSVPVQARAAALSNRDAQSLACLQVKSPGDGMAATRARSAAPDVRGEFRTQHHHAPAARQGLCAGVPWEGVQAWPHRPPGRRARLAPDPRGGRSRRRIRPAPPVRRVAGSAPEQVESLRPSRPPEKRSEPGRPAGNAARSVWSDVRLPIWHGAPGRGDAWQRPRWRR